jgi:hypothetical protein
VRAPPSISSLAGSIIGTVTTLIIYGRWSQAETLEQSLEQFDRESGPSSGAVRHLLPAPGEKGFLLGTVTRGGGLRPYSWLLSGTPRGFLGLRRQRR